MGENWNTSISVSNVVGSVVAAIMVGAGSNPATSQLGLCLQLIGVAGPPSLLTLAHAATGACGPWVCV